MWKMTSSEGKSTCSFDPARQIEWEGLLGLVIIFANQSASRRKYFGLDIMKMQ